MRIMDILVQHIVLLEIVEVIALKEFVLLIVVINIVETIVDGYHI